MTLARMLAACWMVAVCGCAMHAGEGGSIDQIAATGDMGRRLIRGTRFEHLVYTQGDLASARRVHIYLEGDGIPWRTRHRVSSDPTPRDPLALRLMARDPTPAVYVGRPCYFGRATADGCSAWLWTHGRYGEEVVESMVGAIARVLPAGGEHRIVLIGYSGGGALAALIAPRLAGATGLVTLAANLDIDAWADHRGYSRLSGSLNPAEQPPIDPGIGQLHLIGARDREVPAPTLARFLARNPQAKTRIFGDFDHRCCWVERWPVLLGQLEE